MKSVNSVRFCVQLAFFFYSLTSRTRNDSVELIVKKNYCYSGLLVFWKLHFTM